MSVSFLKVSLMKHVLLQNEISYRKRSEVELPHDVYYNRSIGAWVKTNTTTLLIRDKNFPWAATKKKDISLGEDMK